MTVNPYFDHLNASNEQELWEDLIVESIQMYGMDILYVPYQFNNKDKIYGDDDTASFEQTYQVEVYLEDFDGFRGDQGFMSKLGGWEIRDQITFTIARRRFDAVVAANTAQPRPFEGDLIYFPLNNKCFEIRSVEDKPFFYPLGKLQTYKLTCELFEYSSERFNTGNTAVDRIEGLSLDAALLAGANNEIEDVDPFADNAQLQTEANTLFTFNPSDPFSENGP